jgi:hypothetical protein
MLESIVSEVSQVSQIIREIYSTPLAMPIFLALMWRIYVGKLSFYTIPGALVTAVVVSYLLPNFQTPFLDFQKSALEAFLRSLDAMPELLALVKSWDIESKLLSARATVFAFMLFCVLILPMKGQTWYQNQGMFMLMFLVVTVLTLGCWSLFIRYGLPNMVPKGEELEKMTMEHGADAFRRGVEYLVSLPVAAAGWGMSIWVLLCFAVTFSGKHPIQWAQLARHPLMEVLMPVIISVVILAFALSGFLFLQAFQATLWLIFWVAAYPVALAFNRGDPLRGEQLVEIYKAGLTQIPFIGQFFATSMGRPPTTPKDNVPRPKPAKRKREQIRGTTPSEKESKESRV